MSTRSTADIQVYNLTALVHSIEIDPKALDKKDSLQVRSA
jgi:hypothetical protein